MIYSSVTTFLWEALGVNSFLQKSNFSTSWTGPTVDLFHGPANIFLYDPVNFLSGISDLEGGGVEERETNKENLRGKKVIFSWSSQNHSLPRH